MYWYQLLRIDKMYLKDCEVSLGLLCDSLSLCDLFFIGPLDGHRTV